MCETYLKIRCRELGLFVWPFRELLCLTRRLERIVTSSRKGLLTAAVLGDVDCALNRIKEIVRNPLTGEWPLVQPNDFWTFISHVVSLRFGKRDTKSLEAADALVLLAESA